jgi:hypothetical protein
MSHKLKKVVDLGATERLRSLGKYEKTLVKFNGTWEKIYGSILEFILMWSNLT